MAGHRSPLPIRRLHGPTQPTRTSRGGGAAGPDGVIVQPAEDPTNRSNYTTRRDVTSHRAAEQSAEAIRQSAASGDVHVEWTDQENCWSPQIVGVRGGNRRIDPAA